MTGIAFILIHKNKNTNFKKQEERKMEGKDIFKDAVLNGRAKLYLRERHCTFCNETKRCLSWCPEPSPFLLPVCESCFVKIQNTFGRTGALVWE